MKHKLESRLPGEISKTSYVSYDTNLMAESTEKLETFLMKVKEENEKVDLRSWHPDRETMETVTGFLWRGGVRVGLQNYCKS